MGRQSTLKEAILECTREEIRRTLFELVGKHPDGRSSSYHRDSLPAASKRRTSRPPNAEQLHRISSSPKVLSSSPLFQQQGRFKPSRQVQVRLPLEVDVPKNAKHQLERSTSIILEKSLDILTKAGRRLSKFKLDETDNHEDSGVIEPLSRTTEIETRDRRSWPETHRFVARACETAITRYISPIGICTPH
jgi:hypothetical protein